MAITHVAIRYYPNDSKRRYEDGIVSPASENKLRLGVAVWLRDDPYGTPQNVHTMLDEDGQPTGLRGHVSYDNWSRADQDVIEFDPGGLVEGEYVEQKVIITSDDGQPIPDISVLGSPLNLYIAGPPSYMEYLFDSEVEVFYGDWYEEGSGYLDSESAHGAGQIQIGYYANDEFVVAAKFGFLGAGSMFVDPSVVPEAFRPGATKNIWLDEDRGGVVMGTLIGEAPDWPPPPPNKEGMLALRFYPVSGHQWLEGIGLGSWVITFTQDYNPYHLRTMLSDDVETFESAAWREDKLVGYTRKYLSFVNPEWGSDGGINYSEAVFLLTDGNNDTIKEVSRSTLPMDIYLGGLLVPYKTYQDGLVVPDEEQQFSDVHGAWVSEINEGAAGLVQVGLYEEKGFTPLLAFRVIGGSMLEEIDPQAWVAEGIPQPGPKEAIWYDHSDQGMVHALLSLGTSVPSTFWTDFKQTEEVNLAAREF